MLPRAAEGARVPRAGDVDPPLHLRLGALTLLHFLLGARLAFHRRAHEHETVVVPRYRARDEQQVLVGFDAGHEQVLDRDLVDSEVAGEVLALPDLAGRLALADRADVPVVLVRGGAVARGALHVPALEDTLEPAALGGAGDVDALGQL